MIASVAFDAIDASILTDLVRRYEDFIGSNDESKGDESVMII